MAARKPLNTYRSGIRLPEPLAEALQASASARGISMNDELIRRLSNSLRDDPALENIQAAQAIQRELLEEILAKLSR